MTKSLSFNSKKLWKLDILSVVIKCVFAENIVNFIVEMFTVCVGRRKYRLFPQVHLPRNNVKNLRDGYRVSEYIGTKI